MGKPTTPRPPGVPLPSDKEENDRKPGPAERALIRALVAWPGKRTVARGTESPPPLKTIDDILNEDVFKSERPKRLRTRMRTLFSLLRPRRGKK